MCLCVLLGNRVDILFLTLQLQRAVGGLRHVARVEVRIRFKINVVRLLS